MTEKADEVIAEVATENTFTTAVAELAGAERARAWTAGIAGVFALLAFLVPIFPAMVVMIGTGVGVVAGAEVESGGSLPDLTAGGVVAAILAAVAVAAYLIVPLRGVTRERIRAAVTAAETDPSVLTSGKYSAMVAQRLKPRGALTRREIDRYRRGPEAPAVSRGSEDTTTTTMMMTSGY